MFENAHKGVNKLFVAQVLNLIGAVLLVFGVFMAALTAASTEVTGAEAATAGFGVTALLTLIPGVVVPIVAEVFTLVGLYQASKDEDNYLKKAFWMSVGILALSAFSGGVMGFTGNQTGFFAGFMELIQSLLTIWIFFFTVQGINALAQQIGRDDLVSKGTRLMYVYCGVYAAGALAGILSNAVGAVAAILSLILFIVAYVLYLTYLSQARSAIRGR